MRVQADLAVQARVQEHVERVDLIWLLMAAVVLAAESARAPRVCPWQMSARRTPAV